MNIADIRYGMSGISVEGRIESVSERRRVNTRYGPRTVADATIQDDTGTIKLSLWEEKIDKVDVGDKIKIVNAYVTEFRNELQLNIPRSEEIKISRDNKIKIQENQLDFNSTFG